MKCLNILSIMALIAIVAACSPQAAKDSQVSIVPLPASLEVLSGVYQLPPMPTVSVEGVDSLDAVRLFDAVEQSIKSAKLSEGRADINLELTAAADSTTSPEGYTLSIEPTGVYIKGSTPAGLFYGVQSLLQIVETAGVNLPLLNIVDEPRLQYRGMMLDISRHFRDAEFIKKQINAMAQLKMNRLHLHLTDGAGWRIAIDKYPQLTQNAAWRPQEQWHDWDAAGAHYAHEGDSAAYGGYLTADDVRGIVAYAADRYITVIPEIEMPGHSAEVTATIPQLACPSGTDPHHDLCIGNPLTMQFLRDVIDEVIDLFPSHYIHIGGDEASKQAWKTCPRCQDLMRRKGLTDVDQLQSYAIAEMERYINSKGRDIIGWDEIMEGGLAPNATVMSWRGTEGGIKAADSGHKAIMTPGAYCYLDGYQDAPYSQPQAFGGYLPLKKVYSYNPVPDSLDAHVRDMIIGVQGNLWCEYVPTAEHAEYMLYPRLYAIAEIGWTPQEQRSWESFRPRADLFNKHLARKGYNVFNLDTEIGNRPEAETPIDHLAKGKKVIYNVPYWDRYPAGRDTTLTDGLRGGWNYNDGLWQGYLYRGDMRLDVTVDLEQTTDISYIGATFMQMCGPDVWMPQRVVIQVSTDGDSFTTLSEIEHTQVRDDGVSFQDFAWEGNTVARYVRYQAFSSRGVLFTDEIVVR